MHEYLEVAAKLGILVGIPLMTAPVVTHQWKPPVIGGAIMLIAGVIYLNFK